MNEAVQVKFVFTFEIIFSLGVRINKGAILTIAPLFMQAPRRLNTNFTWIASLVSFVSYILNILNKLTLFFLLRTNSINATILRIF